MLEETVANFIDTGTDLAVGVDLSLSNLLETNKEGTTVLYNREIPSWDEYDRCLLQVILFYYDNVACRELSIVLMALLKDRVGIAGYGWAVESVRSENLGIDQFNRHIISISVEVVYKEA